MERKSHLTQPISCGSCRAPARLRRRSVRRRKCQQCRRLRSLARARQLPQLSFGVVAIASVDGAQIPPDTTDLLWALSSSSEAAKAVCQAKKIPALPAPSQPRQGSTAPTVELRCCRDCVSRYTASQPTQQIPCGSCRASARLRRRSVRRRKCQQCRRLRSLARARQLPQLSFGVVAIASVDGAKIPPDTTDLLWELSSFSEAAKAECQAKKMPAVPPPSQPRQGSTAPHSILVATEVGHCRCTPTSPGSADHRVISASATARISDIAPPRRRGWSSKVSADS